MKKKNTCHYCNGEGHKGSYENICNECSGMGYIPELIKIGDIDYSIQCPDCNNKGAEFIGNFPSAKGDYDCYMCINHRCQMEMKFYD